MAKKFFIRVYAVDDFGSLGYVMMIGLESNLVEKSMLRAVNVAQGFHLVLQTKFKFDAGVRDCYFNDMS